MREEVRFLTVQNIAQQLDVLIDAQQRLGISIENIPPEERPTIMRHQDGIIQNCVLLGRKIDPTLALALAIQKKMWDIENASQLFQVSPWCTTSELDYSFEQYASRRTGRDPVTISNWTRTAELWLLDGMGPEGEISLIDPKTGLVLLEQTDNETKPITKKWDPFEVDFTKLLLVNKAAREGQLDDTFWGLLANPASRWVDVRDALHGLLPWNREPKDKHTELGFFLQNGMLYVRKGERSEVIGSLEIDSESWLVREGVARLIRTHNMAIVI